MQLLSAPPIQKECCRPPALSLGPEPLCAQTPCCMLLHTPCRPWRHSIGTTQLQLPFLTSSPTHPHSLARMRPLESAPKLDSLPPFPSATSRHLFTSLPMFSVPSHSAILSC